MLAFFVSIIILTAGIATGVLFHVFPQNQSQEVKGVITASEPTVHVSVNTPTIPDTVSSSSEITDVPPSQLSPTSSTASNPVPFTPTLQPIPSINPSPTTSISITPSIFPISPSPIPMQITPTPNMVPTISITVAASTSADIGQSSNSQGLNADIIFNIVNTHRTTLGLPAFVKDNTTCTIAQQRAPQVYNEIFVTGNIDAGLKAMNIPYWITENIIYDDTEQDAVKWWLNDATHRQIMEGNYTYSCIACAGNACAEIFTNYIAK